MASNDAPIEVKPILSPSVQRWSPFCGRSTGACTSCEKKLPTGEVVEQSGVIAESSGVAEGLSVVEPSPVEVASVCQFIYRGGYMRGQHCSKVPGLSGYCEFCEITQRYRPEAEGLARCKFQWDETAYKRTITCNTFLPDEDYPYCVRCRARANPRVSIPYPTTIEELENQDVDDGDWVEIAINRMNRIRLTDPANCDEMWGFEIVVPNDSDYDDESSWDINLYLDRVQIRKWSSADVTQYLGYALDRDQMSFESNPGNAIDPPEIYYYFQQDGFMHGRFTLYPERGIVTEDTGTNSGPIIFAASDWIAHFGQP